MDFGGHEVVLGLLDIQCNVSDNVVCSGLFGGGVGGEWSNRQDDAGRSASLQLESREAGGCVYGVHHGKPYAGEFGQPSLLVVVDVVPNGLVHGFVGLFTAAISFRVVGGGHL
jgi:hypothetical protein